VSKSRPKTRWTREFKLQALARMDAAADINALAQELGVGRRLLYTWRNKYRTGGADALHAIGRPLERDWRLPEASVPSTASAKGAEQRRIEELERKIGQQQVELDFFRAALRHVREQRLPKGGPGETPFTR
jgi:transposase-like protein